MASPGVVPAIEPPKEEFSWKRLFIKAAGFGAGFALLLGVLAAAGIWYSNRPKPWNSKAVTTTFQDLEFLKTTEEYESIEANYFVTNNSRTDYRLPKSSTILVKVPETNGLTENSEIQLVQDYFIPAKQKVHVAFRIPFEDGKRFYELVTKNDQIEMSKLLLKNLKEIDGFVIFDEGSKYEIAFANGWKQGLEKNAKGEKGGHFNDFN